VDFLPDSPLFTSLDPSEFGRVVADALADYRRNGPPKLPVTRRTGARLVALPALTKVPAWYVRRCGQALRKVVEAAREIRDLRTP